ncbi:hypothetical protein [Actinocatenispora rupis]|uniref:Uncharacterized protein n=1 Tax=Actinocatenispora rupis TaxID=519421 RepID=A0A8J3ND32_9ACTN|nr:hypothetical protein [Actinocatenispora rupis]GID11084.1 hypothetical protein Aru02nite_19730 [Actinocatenispora rupis]
MTDRSDLDAALNRVVEAARAHLAAVRAAGGRTEDDGVWQSYVELNNASFAYDEALLDEFGEVTPWDVEPIDPAEADQRWDAADEAVDGADERQVTVSVRQRRDYTVPNSASLLRAAEAIRRATVHAPDADGPVRTVGAAVAELMQAGDGSLGSLDVPELEPLGGVVTVTEVARPLDPDTLDDSDDSGPFVLAADEKVLYRFDEHVEER